MSLFSDIIGCGPENISTAVLSYLLMDETRFSSFQKLFFHRTIDVIQNSSDINADVLLQEEHPKGIPDITIITSGTLILIENKLLSSLSSEQQLIKYVDILADLSKKETYFNSNKFLVLLAPLNLLDYITIQNEKACQKLNSTTFSDYCNRSKVIFKRISWENVISDLDKSDSIQTEFYNYIQEYIEEGFSMAELNAIKNENVASALQKIYGQVYKMSTLVDSKQFNKGRVTQSYKEYGFYLDNGKIRIWFGFWLKAWAKFGNPVFAYISSKKFKQLWNVIEKVGFEDKKDNEWGYIYAFTIDEIDSWPRKMNEIIHQLEDTIN